MVMGESSIRIFILAFTLKIIWGISWFSRYRTEYFFSTSGKHDNAVAVTDLIDEYNRKIKKECREQLSTVISPMKSVKCFQLRSTFVQD
jgi:hypothetical protein